MAHKSRQLVGKVKSNPSDDWKGAEGLNLILFEVNGDTEDILVIRPITLEQMEQFYKVSYDTFGKEMISEDYDYFIWYMLDDDCEFCSHISINDLETTRELINEDIKLHNENLEEFKKLHNFYKFVEQS